MTIYLDSDYRCHLEYDGTMQAVETDVFDGKPREYIEGYQYIPDGQTWTRSDGKEFYGLMIAPAVDYDRIMVDVALSYLDDEEADSVTILYKEWKTATEYIVGDRRQHRGVLYTCKQKHKSQSDWTPDITPALWRITYTDPFPEWVQPTGAHDAYDLGAHVSHLGKHWESDLDANVYEPSVYGWHEVE